jgi:DNA-binding MarR family transcriptional regulator
MMKIPGAEAAPYVGALLRLGHRAARARLLHGLAERGFGDINEAYFGLFQYPGIDSKRPSTLARQLDISKQALNHLLGQLEKRGYLERRSDPTNGHIVVCYTERGWQVLESNIAIVRQLEAEWQRQLGKARFAELKKTLRELSGLT